MYLSDVFILKLSYTSNFTFNARVDSSSIFLLSGDYISFFRLLNLNQMKLTILDFVSKIRTSGLR